MEDAELRQLAADIYHNKVFTSGHITPGEMESGLIRMIFMPLALMGGDGMKEFLASEPYLIYEYMDKAGERSVNGYPCFFSCRSLNKAQTAKLNEFYQNYKALQEQWNANGIS